ncbi:hypothetical protein FLAG1_11839 [Fusarium langsethiae]|uniref:Uncharacterized protein n=1 Tax=Fusarium langsethiae TaxID=179993 RepID=A0A0M9EM37_FUSLA|nr:hypothetical protein FLAG1_11839 [Fusarium langsethiae]GKU13736.1 unnamed protein product [Fusarium langsethiae]
MAYHDSTAARNDYGNTYQPERETGLLTRWVPEKLKHSGLYRWLLRLTRVGQFLSSVISLGLFSARLRKVYNIVNVIKTRRGVSAAFGAVEGILAAAVLYTLVGMILSLLLKGGGPRWLRWLWVLLDIAFVGAFIAVSVLTRPDGGPAGPKHCYDTRGLRGVFGNERGTTDDSCNLPWGTFILAIISTLLHAITAAFHEVRERRKEHHVEKYPAQEPYNQPGHVHETHAQPGYAPQDNVQGHVGNNRAAY